MERAACICRGSFAVSAAQDDVGFAILGECVDFSFSLRWLRSRLPRSWPILIDAAVLKRDVVVIGSGLRRSKIALPSAALTELPGAEVIDGLAA